MAWWNQDADLVKQAEGVRAIMGFVCACMGGVRISQVGFLCQITQEAMGPLTRMLWAGFATPCNGPPVVWKSKKHRVKSMCQGW